MYVNCACMNSEKRYFSSPFSGEHFRVREIFLVSILSVWGENLTLLKVSFWLQIWSLAYIFFLHLCIFLFILFCSFCEFLLLFCFGSACHGRGRGENFSVEASGGCLFSIPRLSLSPFLSSPFGFFRYGIVSCILLCTGWSALCLWVQCCDLSYVCLWWSRTSNTCCDLWRIFWACSVILSPLGSSGVHVSPPALSLYVLCEHFEWLISKKKKET